MVQGRHRADISFNNLLFYCANAHAVVRYNANTLPFVPNVLKSVSKDSRIVQGICATVKTAET